MLQSWHQRQAKMQLGQPVWGHQKERQQYMQTLNCDFDKIRYLALKTRV